MKFTPQLDQQGNYFWLVELRCYQRLLMAEGNTLKEAIENSMKLVEEMGIQAARRKFPAL
ncbi:hypothetical protein [Oceanospirillum sediminis]|uniref:Type II toxin-antitoxin system HicB family antitoxin n=1 Tax=Oceanospirillum sediminis TaxID=2760088 RepID=A0A839IWR2_9GAMM|nr:hypothetical protein [Oceanospirillum sediminis]MBB1487092.1 hypothetical protein [Oceanospirillum sediminis]MBB1489064.1 hypothetical protein [Oceanospirillum sediminis]